MPMRFLLTALIFISTSSFADNHRCEDRGNDPEVCDLFDEVSDTFQDEILEVLAVGAVLVAITAYAIAEGTQENGGIKYDFSTSKIIFSTGSKLDNLEINFSNPSINSRYEFMPSIQERHYMGFTWKY